MLRLVRPALDPAVSAALQRLQSKAGADRKKLWDAFRARKVAAQDQVFEQVNQELQGMSRGRCALCETSGPGTVEHLVPKAIQPARMFDWNNLLPACGDCNRNRENSRIQAIPLDPSAVEPLDFLGWDDLGHFIFHPLHQRLVEDTVTAYQLQRFDESRAIRLRSVQALVFLVYHQEPVGFETMELLREHLGGMDYLGAVREYLLRPPDHHGDLIDIALEKVPQIRDWVRPWLNPPSWAAPRWP
jgi:hypothetical protein